jgi:hypothetical protein
LGMGMEGMGVGVVDGDRVSWRDSLSVIFGVRGAGREWILGGWPWGAWGDVVASSKKWGTERYVWGGMYVDIALYRWA